jgi:4-hydroxy-3-polyprenylbenzoate decarboxylase
LKDPCHEIVQTGKDLVAEGGGLASLPVPISTPGFDSAPYLTATLCVTKDPENGIQNMGTYRAALKANDRLGVRMASRLGGAGGYLHWQKYKKLGKPMPCAIVVGCAPAVLFTGPQKLPIDVDEMDVAGGLIGKAVRTVRCKTVDLIVPADSEIVIEGVIDTDLLEPEGPFGESHGHVALEDFNMSMQVTAIKRKRKPVFLSIISQVTPSESSVLKKVAYEPMFLEHLRHALGIRGIKRVVMHEPLTNLRKVIFLKFERARHKQKCGGVCRGRRHCRRNAESLSSPCRTIFHRTMPTPSSGPWPIDQILWRMRISSPIGRAVMGPSPAVPRLRER